MSQTKQNKKITAIAFAVVASLVLTARTSYQPLTYGDSSKVFAVGGNPGAVWTTDVSCTVVNDNVNYATKQDVYLNGGPQGGSNNGLPDGYYYVKVTEPNGTLLGHISDGVTVHVTNGSFDTCYNLYDLTEFADTSNNGGEYKVWVSQYSDFPGGSTKTDNFKVGSVSPSPSTSPSDSPSASPSDSPSASPSESPSASPSESPSASPSDSPSASPTSSPSDQPSPSPSDSASPSPSASTQASPSPSASASPSPSSSAASSSTPAPSDNSGDNSDNSGDSSGSSNESSSGSQEGEVLGAYAETGTVQDAIMNMLGSIGGLMTAAGTVLYGKKKSKKNR